MLDLIRRGGDVFDRAVAVGIMDPDRRLIHVNPAFETLFGYTAAEVIGRSTDIIYAQAEAAEAVGREWVNAGTVRADPYPIEFRRKDGSTFPGMSIAFPTFDASGAMTGAVGIARDCTKEVRREDALRTLHSIASDRHLDATEKAAAILAFGCEYFDLPLGIISRIEGADYTVVHAHSPNGEIEPGTRFELTGTYCREVHEANGAVGFHHVCAQVPEHPCYVTTGLECYLGAPVHAGTRPFGTINFTSASRRETPFSASDLEMIGMIADWASDQITIERTLEHLEQARVRAEEASLSKSRFLANMSHEIRTPMTGVLGYADVLLKGDLAPDQRPCAERIVSAGRSLLGILDDVLDLSRMEAGKLETVREPLSPGHVLTGCAGLMAADAKKRGVTLTCAVDAAVPETVLGDPLRLREVVLNLLGNALKFTAEGGVTLTCRPEGTRMVIEVADTGIGIAPGRIEKVMADFTQADETTQRRYGGTGLGLSISRKLAALMGGRLTLRGEVGRGTTVTLTLPMERVAPIDMVAAVTAVPRLERDTRVLLVEDVEFNREMFRMMLEGAGYAVTEAGDGRAAIEAVRAAGPGGFDAVVMDVQMPDVDGLTAARMMRRTSGWEETPIIALSAGAFPDEIAACREAGMSDHVAKPTTAEVLCGRVAHWLAKRGAGAGGAGAGGAGAAEGSGEEAALGSAASGADALPPLPDLLPDLPEASRERLIGQFGAMLDGAASQLRELSDALAMPDPAEALERVAGLAHKVKGSAAMMGLNVLTDAAGDAEAAGREGRHDAAVTDFTAMLDGTARRLAERAA